MRLPGAKRGWCASRPGDRNQWLEPAARSTPRASRRRMTRRARILLTCLALAAAGLTGALAIRSGLVRLGASRLDEALALQTISIEGNRRANAAELVAVSGLTAGMPLPDVDVDTVRALVETHPWVQRARAVRVPPSVVIVSVVEREPLVVATGPDGPPWLVDATGLPFTPASPDDVASLPWLVAPHAVTERVATTELARGAALALALRGSTLFEGAEIHVAPPPDPDGLSLLVSGLRARIVLGHGDLSEKLRRLERLRAAALPETTDALVIDLRFADRAVLRSATAPGLAQQAMGAPANGAHVSTGRRL